MNIILYRERGL